MVHLYWIDVDGKRETGDPQGFGSVEMAASLAHTTFNKGNSPYLSAEIIDPNTGKTLEEIPNEFRDRGWL